MAMIFVPSKDGISHSPKEFTPWTDVGNGTEVLYRTLLLLDSLQDQKGSYMRIGGNVMAAKIVHKVSPLYSPIAQQTGIRGIVRLNAIIGKDGKIEKVEFESGHPLLKLGALEAVRKWQDQRTLLNGEPVRLQTAIDVPFGIKESPPPKP